MFAIKQFGDFTPDIPYIRAYETPIGQITTSVRRMRDLYYSRVNEIILPNFAKLADGLVYGDAIAANQIAPEIGNEAAPLKYTRQLPSSRGLGLSMWVIPNDNTSCMFFGWHHFPVGEDPKIRERRISQVTHGQMADRSYEERHRNPGDFDMLVSQGVNVSRDNDQLTVADAGIALYRKQLREGIRAVQAGKTPKGPANDSRGTIPTYACSLFRPAPEPADEAEENRRKEAFERDVTAAVLSGSVPHTPRIFETA
jgi:hypothetical protein